MKIKPSFPYLSLLIVLTFIAISLALTVSPYQDWKMLIASVFSGTLGIGLLWAIDYSHLHISYSPNIIKFRGYFFIRKFELNILQIEGYQIHQKVDQIKGFHEEIQIVKKDGRNLIFPKIAYKNYEEIKSLCDESELKFLGYKTIKYGEFLGKLIPVMFLISGIFAFLVALIKILK
jgi:hypothetical protein